MSIEAWASLIVMALFNVLSTAFYLGVNKQMLNEVMRRLNVIEGEKAEKEFVALQIGRIETEQVRLDREVTGLRYDVKGLMTQRGSRDIQ